MTVVSAQSSFAVGLVLDIVLLVTCISPRLHAARPVGHDPPPRRPRPDADDRRLLHLLLHPAAARDAASATARPSTVTEPAAGRVQLLRRRAATSRSSTGSACGCPSARSTQRGRPAGRQGRRRLRLRLRGDVHARRARPRSARPRWSTSRSAPDLVAHPKVRAIEGSLPETHRRSVEDASLDVVLCMSVHRAPLGAGRSRSPSSAACCAPAACARSTCPSWRGQAGPRVLRVPARALAGRGDGRPQAYYDPRDLWPLLVRAGFMPARHPAASATSSA